MTELNALADRAAWGLRIIESPYLTEVAEDWSDVRSPSRAARRLKQGHKQRIRRYYKPSTKVVRMPNGSIVMHPEVAAALRAQGEG